MDTLTTSKTDYLKKRQQFAIQLRRQTRQQLLSKRRNLQNQQTYIDPNSSQPINNLQYIVDPRYKQQTSKFYKTRVSLQNLPQLRKSINDPDIIKQHFGIICIRKIMSLADDPPIQTLIDSGIIPRLIQFISQTQYPQLQLEATWTLANVASGTSQQCQSIINKGGIQLFINLLKSPYIGIVQQAVWAIGNIASDSSFNRDLMIKAKAIPHLIQLVKNKSKSSIREPCLWSLSNLCRTYPLPTTEDIKQAIPTISQLLSTHPIKQSQTFIDCCWAISYNFPQKPSDYKKILTKPFIASILQKFIQFSNNNYQSIISIMRVIIHITNLGNEYISQIFTNQNILDHLTPLLYCQKKLIRSDTCTILANIASCSQKYLDLLIHNQKLLLRLLEMFENDNEDIKKQICMFFANFTICGHPDTILRFYKQMSIVKYYLTKLSQPNPRLVLLSLQSLYQFLKLGQKYKSQSQTNPIILDLINLNGLILLQQLQMHENNHVYTTVVKIMKEFFQIEDGLLL